MNVSRDWERGEGATVLAMAGSSGYRRTWRKGKDRNRGKRRAEGVGRGGAEREGKEI